jgi:hypothetical protein
MGWGRMMLLGDWGQQLDIEDQRKEMRTMRRRLRQDAKRSKKELLERLDQLERDNAEMRLYLAALIRYLGGKGVVERDEFKVLVDVIDSEDGEVDGKFDGEIAG